MRLTVILLEPEYDENMGLVARAMKNFGFSRLVLVKPKTSPESGKAKSRAMHAVELLQNAKTLGSLEEALALVDFSAATTAVSTRGEKMSRNALTPEELAERFAGTSAELGVVFGRESTGLSNEEISQCDFVVSIPSSHAYKTLNVSHAAAIILARLFSARSSVRIKTASAAEKNSLVSSFERMLDASEKIRNRRAVLGSFRALLARAPLTKKEASALTGVFAETAQKIKE